MFSSYFFHYDSSLLIIIIGLGAQRLHVLEGEIAKGENGGEEEVVPCFPLVVIGVVGGAHFD